MKENVALRDFADRLAGPKGFEGLLKKYCMKSIGRDMPPLRSVLEPFAGIGLIWDALVEMGLAENVEQHEAWELSEKCFDLLRKKHPNSRVVLGDALLAEFRPLLSPSFLSFDPNSCTVARLAHDRRYRQHFEHLISLRPDYVEFTDTAINKLHLNAGVYADLTGRLVSDANSYFRAASAYYRRHFGYGVERVAYHHGAAYLLLRPGAARILSIERFTKEDANHG